MYTKTGLVSILLAAIGTTAAPSPVAERATSIPLNIYEGTACDTAVISTAFVPTDGSCFPVSPILSGDVDSFRIDMNNALPKGCFLYIYNNVTCEINNGAGNVIPFEAEHRCSTFGRGNKVSNFIRAARAVGTCA